MVLQFFWKVIKQKVKIIIETYGRSCSMKIKDVILKLTLKTMSFNMNTRNKIYITFSIISDYLILYYIIWNYLGVHTSS